MSSAHVAVDLDDTDGLLEADRDGLLRSAATAGAQVRATAAAVEEGACEFLASDQRPRTVIWLAGRVRPKSARAMLAASLDLRAVEPIVTAAQVPPWIGPWMCWSSPVTIRRDRSGLGGRDGGAPRCARGGCRAV